MKYQKALGDPATQSGNSIKSLSFTHPEDVLYDKGPHVNFGFAVNYSLGTKNLEAYKVNKYLIAEFIEYQKYQILNCLYQIRKYI